MLKIIRFALLILLFAAALPASADGAVCPPAVAQPTPEMVQAGMKNARDHGFLWRISKDGRTSFLYGTIHVAKFDWTFPGPKVSQAMQASDTVALEMDLLDADIQERMLKGMAAMRRVALPDPLLKRMRRQAQAVCVAYDAIVHLSPELQVTMLAMMVGRRAGLEAGYAIDAVLAQIGHRATKNVVSLETPEMQLQLLQMKDTQETIAFVRDSLDELETGRSLQMLKRIAKVWEDADYSEMARFDEWCECLNTETEREVMKRALDERNPALAEHIDVLHNSGKQVFAAVGSLHMFGSIGLPALMEKRGYTVERVNYK